MFYIFLHEWMPYIDFRSWRRPNWRYRRLIRDCTLRVSKEKRIPSEFLNTSNYDNLLNSLWVDGAARRFTILKRESLQPGSNNKCNFIYNSLYRFWICSVWCLRFTASKQHPYKALQPARPNRPTILIILLLGVHWVIFSLHCWRECAHVRYVFTVARCSRTAWGLHAWNNNRLSRDHSSCQTWSPQTVAVLARSTDARYMPCGCQDTAVTAALYTFKC